MLFHAASGEKKEAFAMMKDLREVDNAIVRLDILCLLGEKEEALAIFKKMSPQSSYLTMRHHPYYQVIRDSPDFKMALEEAKVTYDEKLSKYGGFRL